MRSSEQFLCLPGNGYGWNEYMLYGSRKRNKKRFIASDVTRFVFVFSCSVKPLSSETQMSSISAFLHFCIAAFLHFCIARLLQFWICSRMLRCVYFCISMSFCRDLSESVGVN